MGGGACKNQTTELDSHYPALTLCLRTAFNKWIIIISNVALVLSECFLFMFFLDCCLN